MRSNVFVIAVACATMIGCSAEPEPEPTPEPEVEAGPVAPPAMITAERGGFIPEGIEYDTTNGRFLTGSLSEGSIFQIHDDGRVTAVIVDPDLVSSVGIEVDEPRNRLLVANSDRGVFDGEVSGQAMLGAYDLASGERLAMVDLAGVIANPGEGAAYFANDVAVGADGTAYVTDSRMNVVYQVGDDYTASVLHRFEPMEGLGLNGIVYHDSGYLLVAGGSTLYKVPVSDPGSASEVEMAEAVGGQDGMLWTADGSLAIVSNSDSRVVALTSSDDWATAEIVGIGTYEAPATTAAAVGEDLYVIHPHFADEDPPSIERVALQ